MIDFLIQTYFSSLLIIGVTALILLAGGSFFIFRKAKEEPPKILPDITAIAGDSIHSTQIDLARAFIETGNKDSARAILKAVTKQGNALHKQEAQKLLKAI